MPTNASGSGERAFPYIRTVKIVNQLIDPHIVLLPPLLFCCPKKVFDSLAAANIKRVFCTHSHTYTTKRWFVRLRLIEIKSAMLELFLFKSWLYDDITCTDYAASPFHKQHIHSWWMCECALLILDILLYNIHKQNIAIKCRSVLKLGQKFPFIGHTHTRRNMHMYGKWSSGAKMGIRRRRRRKSGPKRRFIAPRKYHENRQIDRPNSYTHTRISAHPTAKPSKWVSNFYTCIQPYTF